MQCLFIKYSFTFTFKNRHVELSTSARRTKCSLPVYRRNRAIILDFQKSFGHLGLREAKFFCLLRLSSTLVTHYQSY